MGFGLCGLCGSLNRTKDGISRARGASKDTMYHVNGRRPIFLRSGRYSRYSNIKIQIYLIRLASLEKIEFPPPQATAVQRKLFYICRFSLTMCSLLHIGCWANHWRISDSCESLGKRFTVMLSQEPIVTAVGRSLRKERGLLIRTKITGV